MRKIAVLSSVLALVSACTKHDPILPGVRTPIFDEGHVNILNQSIDDLPAAADEIAAADCPYTQDTSNVIWDGDKKIFSGFPTANSVHSTQKPVCAGGFVVAGLTTGEVVKINPKTRQIAWIADVYRPSNMTGGASLLDIVAPIVIDGDAVYVGGMGDAFCRINLSNGRPRWCSQISVSSPFILAGDAAFVIGTDGILHAIRRSDGATYWRTEIGKCTKISYSDGVITACRRKINAHTGE